MQAELAEVTLSGVKSILVKPTAFMNESGQAVAKVARKYAVPAERIVVVHDELDLPFGSLRLKSGGGDNGHNGVISVKTHIGTGEFMRVRMGIGRPANNQAPADYVLSKFDKVQSEALPLTLDLASKAIETLLVSGLAVAQNEFNS
jgi:PTH1 family peptidyl-tRNA hydrolase